MDLCQCRTLGGGGGVRAFIKAKPVGGKKNIGLFTKTISQKSAYDGLVLSLDTPVENNK